MKQHELLLCFDIPRGKSSFRVKIWRDLNDMGARKRTGSIWSLTFSRANLQEFKSIAREINSKGGRAEVFLANVIRITTENRQNVIRITKPINELIKKSILILDKPSGPTSGEVVRKIKEIFKCEKAANTGILDPRATGVLVVALNDAVKAMPVFMGLDKEYEGTMYLHKDVDLKTLEEIISRFFIGEIIQIPPVKSRVARKSRRRRVYSFEIIEKDGQNVKFRTRVQAGTYIRKIAYDIGEKLGVGAHLKDLRRTKVGHFTIEDSHSLEEIKKAYGEGNEALLKKMLIPIEKAIPHVKRVYVKDSSIKAIRNGAPVLSPDIVRVQADIEPKETVGIFSLEDELIALGIAKINSERMLDKKKRSVIRTDRIL
ncbi:MAG: RNA-guided pseudouridylation complex pseudouridine synthase subunit Cbf5 [Candidatus Aenigmarchaeota archaeon]|nr:RNA-guided pseudouridylation complex pseudouridine synthase subunit Cbf5 [Candidatus Aenigmarchaeota archaeon]